MSHSSSSGGPGPGGGGGGGCSGGGMVRSPYNTGMYLCMCVYVYGGVLIGVNVYNMLYMLSMFKYYATSQFIAYSFIYLYTYTGSARSHYPTPPLLQSLLPASLSKLSSLLACRSPLNRGEKGDTRGQNYDGCIIIACMMYLLSLCIHLYMPTSIYTYTN